MEISPCDALRSTTPGHLSSRSGSTRWGTYGRRYHGARGAFRHRRLHSDGFAGLSGEPSWEPNWQPTASVAQPYPATLNQVIPDQNCTSSLAWHQPATLRYCLTVKQVYREFAQGSLTAISSALQSRLNAAGMLTPPAARPAPLPKTSALPVRHGHGGPTCDGPNVTDAATRLSSQDVMG